MSVSSEGHIIRREYDGGPVGGHGEDIKRMLTQESLGASDQLARGIAETRTRLVEEFEERIEPGTIRQIVDEAFEALEDAAIRDFLPLFVYRAAHEQLTDMARASAAR